jgi:hypothetical protein
MDLVDIQVAKYDIPSNTHLIKDTTISKFGGRLDVLPARNVECGVDIVTLNVDGLPLADALINIIGSDMGIKSLHGSGIVVTL